VAARRALVELGARLGLNPPIDALEVPALPAQVSGAAPLAGRPDLRLAERRLEAARQALRLEEARAVPDPSINGGLKRTVGVNTAQFTVTMPLPLFSHNNMARAVAAGAVKAAELDIVAAERRARGEALAARAIAEGLAARTQDVRSALLEPAQAARNAARAAYRAGALDVLRLVDAERVATEATLIVTDLEIDAVAAAIEARLAAGEEPLP
jgi:cobalt-zinc-cadmium efflux system outer membrane protein